MPRAHTFYRGYTLSFRCEMHEEIERDRESIEGLVAAAERLHYFEEENAEASFGISKI